MGVDGPLQTETIADFSVEFSLDRGLAAGPRLQGRLRDTQPSGTQGEHRG